MCSIPLLRTIPIPTTSTRINKLPPNWSEITRFQSLTLNYRHGNIAAVKRTAHKKGHSNAEREHD